ncbi:MAG: iron-containing alcohol dehydrogenase, partial [Acidobacteria bacterium]|nr:iron-containing alcohol dehydrogenase [Acidobacteriota bacterium]
ETWVTTSRNPLSRLYSREAFRLLEGNFEPALRAPDEVEPLAALQLGAWMAGVAIENSMLGAAHACANPLTARYGIIHGVAIAALLPHAVRWNLAVAAGSYRELALELPVRLDQLAAAGGLANRLGDLGVQRSDLVELAQDAAAQWTGRFNPRPFNAEGALEIYQWAF